MAKTELKLKSKRSTTGQNITTTIGYVNPNADSATLKTFGQKLNAMTTNIYEETDRVQTINVDTEEVPGGSSKPAHTLTVTRDWRSSSAALSMTIEFTYDGNLTNLKAFTNRPNDVEQGFPEYTELTTGAENTATLKVVGYGAIPYSKPVLLYEPETDDYAAFLWTGETPNA